jgi:hypothetical protein
VREDIWGALSLNSGATNPVVTLSGSSSYVVACAQEFSGVVHFGATANPSLSGTAWSTSLTTTGSNSLVALGIEQNSGSGTWAATTGTLAIGAQYGAGLANAIFYNPGVTSGSSVTIAGGTGQGSSIRAILLELKSQ